LLIINPAAAEDEAYRVTVIPRSGDPLIVENFNQKGAHHYLAFRMNRKVKLPFKELQAIEFTKPGDTAYPVVITFMDGRKDDFRLLPFGFMEGRSGLEDWRMSHRDVKAIQFVDHEEEVKPKMPEPVHYDRIILKNGDTLSGQILTAVFTLTTFYGTLNFEADKIQQINIQGDGEEVDFVMLKTGDRLSGTIEESLIRIKIDSGKEVVVSKEKIKDVLFRK
jgi:hypothetical protein